MYNAPLVSVIMIVRNGEHFLAEAICSVLAQDYRPIEILVVDGQSTDRTPEIARSFSEVRYLLQPDLGVSNAYNLGVSHTQGELVGFLSHDDLWMPDKLARQVGYFEAYPEIQYAVCRIKYFLDPGGVPPTGFRTALLEQEPVAYIMETLVARRTLFDQVGGFDPSLTTAEDVDWFARVLDARIPGYACASVLLHKRVHAANTSIVAPDNNAHLLIALKRSLRRKRQIVPRGK